MSIESAVAALTTATTDLLDAVNVKQAALDAAVASTADDATATAADRVATGEDRVQTGQDAAATAADRVATGEDRVQTGQDVAAAAADRAAVEASLAVTDGLLEDAIILGQSAALGIPGEFAVFDALFDPAGWLTGGTPRYYEFGDRYTALGLMPNTTFTRATAAPATDLSGALRGAASGAPSIGRYRGQAFWPALQNKLGTSNFAAADGTTGVNVAGTTAVSSAVTRAGLAAVSASASAQLLVIDPGALVTGLKRAVASAAGQTVRLEAVTGNTNAHSMALRAFVISGTWVLEFDDAGGSGAVSSSFATTSRENVTPSSSGRRMQLRCTSSAGDIVYFDERLVEASYAGPSIIVNGAAAFRNADVAVKASAPVNPAGLAVLDWGRFEVTGGLDVAWQWGDGTNNNRFRLERTAANVINLSIVIGGVITTLAGPTVADGSVVKSVVLYEAPNWYLMVNGVEYGPAASALAPGMSTLHPGSNHTATAFRKGTQLLMGLRRRPGWTRAQALALTAP